MKICSSGRILKKLNMGIKRLPDYSKILDLVSCSRSICEYTDQVILYLLHHNDTFPDIRIPAQVGDQPPVHLAYQ